MRVIAGTYRSRALGSPAGLETRPTSDRLRETLFNIIGPQVTGSKFVDLYAGTGAVGIEAISRGAEFVWFSENGPPALKSLRGNLAALKISSGFALEDRGTGKLLQRLEKLTGQIDLVFLDPPYDAEKEYAATLGFLGSKTGFAMLNEGALVLAEHATRGKFELAERYGALSRTRVYKQGETAVSFYSAAPKV